MSERLLLCTDLDRTVLPNGPQPESPGARRLFASLVARDEVTLVYVTGRHRQLVESALASYDLPWPDFVISDVGTTIYATGHGDWTPWQDWHREIAPQWRGQDSAGIRARLQDIADIKAQEPAKQNLYKASYYVPLYVDRDALLHEVQARLDADDIQASLVWSIDEPQATGLLDVLPAGADKLHAIRFLMQRKDFDVSETVFAGDSGNDLDVLASEVPAVLVANASDAVRVAARAQSTRAGADAAPLYLARGDFAGMNGNYTAGVLEGVAHYHPRLGERLLDTCREQRADD